MRSKEIMVSRIIEAGFLKSPKIIEAFLAIDRADFVPVEKRSEAYENYPILLKNNATISQPLTVAFMLELLEPTTGENILDVGFGSGWTTALLAWLAGDKGKVFGVEIDPTLFDFGRQNIEKYDFLKKGMVELFCADGARGLSEKSPFDKILAGAAAAEGIPYVWQEQLKIKGKIVAPVGNSIWRYVKTGENELQREEFPGFSFVPLVECR